MSRAASGSGEGGAGVGEDGVSGVVPADAGEGEAADDEDCFLVGVVGSTHDRIGLRARLSAAEVGRNGIPDTVGCNAVQVPWWLIQPRDIRLEDRQRILACAAGSPFSAPDDDSDVRRQRQDEQQISHDPAVESLDRADDAADEPILGAQICKGAKRLLVHDRQPLA